MNNGGYRSKVLFKRIFLSILVLLVLTLYFHQLFYNFDFSSSVLGTQHWFLGNANNTSMTGSDEWPNSMMNVTPLILSWNTFFGSQTVMNWLLTQNDISHCPFRCNYSDDKALATNASVILFHARDKLTPLPSNRSADQLYAFYLLESPTHTGGYYKEKEIPRDFFNITMTYRRDSDVFAPYDAFDELEQEEEGEEGEESKRQQEERWTEEEVLRRVAAKSELALQFVSNCNTPSRREKYVDALKKHMNVTVMGSCVKGNGTTSGRCDAECAEKLFDSHFFYLAFENSVCTDYLTEKFWKLKKLIVPVVLARSVPEALLMNIPEHVFIAADDFSSVKELAGHLQRVAANRDLYMNYYLQWTRRFKKSEHRKHPVNNPLCQLCKLAHEQATMRKHRRIDDIVNFWEGTGGGKCQDRFAETKLHA